MHIVTGGAGFIGSTLVRELLNQGERVVVLDDFSSGHRANLAGLTSERLLVIETNVADGLGPAMAQVPRAFGEVESIVHLAAQVSVVASIASPIEDARRTYLATVQVLEYARACGKPRVVLASSAAAYGNLGEPIAREPLAQWPASPYGIHKFMSERALHYANEIHDVPTASLRFFNVYGPRQDPRSPYSGVISIFMDRALAGADLTIFGDGTQTRDFVFVGDVARAILAASSRDLSGQVFNIGTGTETSVNALARSVCQLGNGASNISYASARPGEILRSVADVSAARSAFGFEAQVGLAEGLEQTFAWYKSE